MEQMRKVTASRLADIMAKTKSGYAASRQNYMAELIASGLPEGFRRLSAMLQRGTELEPVAREMYVLNQFDAQVVETGFIDHPVIALVPALMDW